MLTAEGCRARRKRLWDSLGRDADLILIGAPRNLAWLAGYYADPYSFTTQNGIAILLLAADGSSTLIVDNLHTRFADPAHVDRLVIADWYQGRESAAARSATIASAVRRAWHGRPRERLRADAGVSASLIHHLCLRHVAPEVIAVDRLALSLSRRKDDDEVQTIRESVRAIEAAFEASHRGARPGMTELQVYQLAHSAALEFAGRPVLVYGDVASGPRAESGGGGPTSRAIESGELLLIDMSVVIQGYRGDLCTTIAVGREMSNRQKEMKAACLDAMKVGESLLRAGIPCREVDSAVRSVFDDRGLGQNFQHHSGHGIGLGHPDPPYIVRESSETLEFGDVVTLEPGCYIPGIGGMRFEHNYLITESGFDRLSTHVL